MASDSVRITIQHQLKQTIEAAIKTNTGFDSAIDLRLLAVETIRDLHNSWAALLPPRSSYKQQADNTVDKIVLLYAAGKKLHRYRDHPDAFPGKIVACSTKPIQQNRKIAVGLLKEILKGASVAPMVETKNIDDMEAPEVSAPPETEKAQDLTGDNNTTPVGEDTIEQGVQSEQDAKTDPSATITADDPPKSKAAGKARAKDGQKAGPGNTSREHNTKWYPDEEQFMRYLIAEHPDWTWSQYAVANTAKFKGTYYTDSTGTSRWGQREGRTGNAVRLRFMEFKNDRKAAAQGSVAAGSSGAPGVVANVTQASGPSTQGAATGDQSGRKDDDNGGAAANAGEVSGGGAGGANTSYPPAEVIYVSGKMSENSAPRRKDQGGAAASAEGNGAASSSTGDDNGEGAAETEVGEDEDPLGDLTEMVARVQAGSL